MYVGLGLNDDFAYIIKARFLFFTFSHYFFINVSVFDSTIWSQVMIPIKHNAMKIKKGMKLVWVCNLGENDASINESLPCCSAAFAFI